MTLAHPSALTQQGWVNALAHPAGGNLLLVVAPHAAAPLVLELAARMAVSGEVRVLDGGNCFNVYPVAKALRRMTSDLDAALKRITLSRAFTCYQMVEMLQNAHAGGTPTLLLDFLATFYDEDVTLVEAQRLVTACVPHLKRLAAGAPLIISVKPPLALAAERQVLISQLEQVADQCWTLENPTPVKQQPGLWE